MPETYKLTTIREIFEKVPTDRIQDCCRELGTLLAQSKALAELIQTTAEGIGVEDGDLIMRMPDIYTWVDDGKGEITTRVCTDEDGDDEVMRLERKPTDAEDNDGA